MYLPRGDPIAEQQCYRFIASSFDGNTIPGHSGTLFTVTLQADETMAAGTYEGKLTNIEFNTTDNQRILFGDLTFTVTVEPEGIKGDVNKDGAMDIADVVAVYNIMAGGHVVNAVRSGQRPGRASRKSKQALLKEQNRLL